MSQSQLQRLLKKKTSDAAWARSPSGRAYQKAYREKRKLRPQSEAEAFEYRVRCVYGIEVIEWASIYNSQDGACASCLKKIGIDFNTVVDHNHETGHIRGIICRKCNSALGFLDDSVEKVKGLLMYLVKQEKTNENQRVSVEGP